MDNVIIEYSGFFNDDGGFEKIKSDFKSLGDNLIKEAKRIKEGVNIFDLSNQDGIQEYEKMAEQLTESFKKFEKAKKDVDKIEQEYIKTQRKNLKLTELQSKNLAELEEQLAGYKNELKENNTLERVGAKTLKEAAETRADLRVKIKGVTQEINKQQKEIIESTKLSKQEEKVLKANITLQKGRATTLAEVRERLSALRIVASQVNITTQEGRDQVAAYNEEIDELTDTLDQNSDKFVQAKINVGNYEESIVNALNSSDLFSTNVGVLDNALGSLVSVLTLNKEQLEEMEKSLGKNSNAVKRFAVGFGKLNKVLKASIIGVVIIAIASLSSLFGDTRAGAIKLQKVTQTLSSSLVIFGKVAAEITGSIGNFFSSIFKGFERLKNISLKDIFTGNVDFSNLFGGDEAEEQTKGLFERIKDIMANGSEAIVDNFANIDKAFALEDRVRRLNLELVKLNGELESLQLIADDSTRSFAEQLDANSKALNKIEEIGRKNEQIARAELEAANERIKANIKLNQEETKNIDLSQKGASFAEATLSLAERRGAQLQISNNLLEEQQEALLKLREVENENEKNREENFKKRREIERDLFEQNLDILIDGIDDVKTRSELIINDTTKNLQDRILEFQRFTRRFRENADKELTEFNVLAKKNAELLRDELEVLIIDPDKNKDRINQINNSLSKLENFNLQIEFGENGDFKVFNNDVQLTLDDLVSLNEQLQKLGIAEIPINRFKEFNKETTNGLKDLKGIEKTLERLNIKTRSLVEENSITDLEIKRLDELNEKRIALQNRARGNISRVQRKKIIKELEDLEKEKDRIREFAEEKRIDSQIDLLTEEISVLEANEATKSERYLELIKQRNALEKKLREDAIKEELDAEKKKQEELERLQKEREKNVIKFSQAILDKIIDSNNKEVQKQEEKVSKQDSIIDEQRSRAELGLKNTLKFEQEQKAEQEAELLKQQTRQQRLEKIKALYSAYANFAASDEQDPLGRALKDFSILEAITASFGDGGIVGVDGVEKVRTNNNGVTVGRSHNMRKGILAYHEGGEGFLSRKEMGNLGEDNFRQIKKRAGLGPLDTNIFTPQNTEFTQVVTKKEKGDVRLVSEVREIVKAIKEKPEQFLDVEGFVDGLLKFTETKTTGNKKIRNHYRIKKRRL